MGGTGGDGGIWDKSGCFGLSRNFGGTKHQDPCEMVVVRGKLTL